MQISAELRLFKIVVGAVLLIPAVAGPVGGFLGIGALARLLQADAAAVALPASIHNSLRAIVWMFFALVPLVLWSLRELKERAGALRIILGCAFVAGFARLTGCLVDGWPGPIPLIIMGLELGLMPVLLLWHRRLIRLGAGGSNI